MTESLLADFSGRVAIDGRSGRDLVTARVLMDGERLILAADGRRIEIPLSSIDDVTVGKVPAEMTEFFDDTARVRFTRNGEHHTAIIEGGEGTVDRFAGTLLETQLGGVPAMVEHPVCRGGRVVEAPAVSGTLTLDADGVTIPDVDSPVRIDRSAVVDVCLGTRPIGGESRPTVTVRHLPAGTVLTSVLSLPAERTTALLGRFLGREYSELLAEVRETPLSDDELEALVFLAAGGDEAGLVSFLDGDQLEANDLVKALGEKGLVEGATGKTAASRTGWIAVFDRFGELDA